MKQSYTKWALALIALGFSIVLIGCDEQKIDLSKFKKPGMSNKAPAPPPMPGSTAGAPDSKDGKSSDVPKDSATADSGKDSGATKPGADAPAATSGK